jgi:hypothetical protein
MMESSHAGHREGIFIVDRIKWAVSRMSSPHVFSLAYCAFLLSNLTEPSTIIATSSVCFSGKQAKERWIRMNPSLPS